jgi:hypothetical protein
MSQSPRPRRRKQGLYVTAAEQACDVPQYGGSGKAPFRSNGILVMTLEPFSAGAGQLLLRRHWNKTKQCLYTAAAHAVHETMRSEMLPQTAE